jgi:hypothetical protein
MLPMAMVVLVLAVAVAQSSCAEMWCLARLVMLSTHTAVDKLDSCVCELEQTCVL